MQFVFIVRRRQAMDNYLEMVRKAKHGSADAFACLYQEIYEDLYRFAVYILKNPADAQDIVAIQ